MRTPGPLLHIAAIVLLVVPAAILWSARRPEARAAPTAERDTITLEDYPPGPAAERGRAVYDKYCVGCHGDDGLGDGAAAALLNPMPRNFQRGNFKFRSTASGSLPTEEDLLRTITCGLAGSAMPGFPLVPDHERRDVAKYVLHLAAFGRARREVEYLIDEEGESLAAIRAESLDEIRADVDAQLAKISRLGAPQAPPSSQASIDHGKAVYIAKCASCHGDTGVGDGPSSYTLRDWRDAEIRPRDFTTGVFRSGSTSADLYLRLKTGLMGTPMPAIPGGDDDLWAMVHYIESMKDPAATAPFIHYGCGAAEEVR